MVDFLDITNRAAGLIPTRYTTDTDSIFRAVHASIVNHREELERCRIPDMRSGKLDGTMTSRVMVEWARKGLVPPPANNGEGWRLFSAFDVAMIKTLVVAKKRGLSLDTLKTIKTALGTTIDRTLDLTLWEFAFFYVNRRFSIARVEDVNMKQAGDIYLVINGANRIVLARADDLPALVKNDTAETIDSPSTYSHIELNLSRIISTCDFAVKINMNPEAFQKNLRRQTLARLNDPTVEKMTIDKTSGRVEIETTTGDNPAFGERIEKFRDGKKAHSIVRTKEPLDVE